MFYRLICRLLFATLLVSFIANVVSCKKENQGILETSNGMNTLFVEIDGQRYEPKSGIIGTVDGQPIVHKGVEFITFNNFMVVNKSYFLKNNVYSFVSDAVLNTPTPSMLSFGLVNIFEAGQQDKMQPVVEGTYVVRENDKPSIVAHCAYKVAGEWDVPYTQKSGSGTLTVTRFTDDVISGKMEVVVERGEGTSYESKKIVLHFDYTMNTINDKVFH